MAQRGRPKGSKNKKVPAAEGEVSSDHNSKPNVAKEPLTDEQQQKLFFTHVELYKVKLEGFKAAQAALKNAGKLIKSEGTRLADVKEAIALESPEGEKALKEDIERKLRVARWMGASIGTQFSFLDEDRTPSVDKAEEDGKRAGMRGEAPNPPHHYGLLQQQAWLKGWHVGQKVNLDRIKETHDSQRAEDAKTFDDEQAPGEPEKASVH